jgi:putative N-acetylmannosamine-6-phosphate epimerase
MSIVTELRGGLIVSCQARPGSPLRHSAMMAAMARAAELGGAVGIRANGPEDVAAIRPAVNLPIIGIYKQDLSGSDVYITPTLDAAQEVAAAGATILALDATARPRPGGMSAAEMIKACHESFGLPIMADISVLSEGIVAAAAGADLVATTLAGYTPYSRSTDGPDFELLEELVAHLPGVPIVVEGHVASPADACHALELGAYAVVVGAAITQPDWITRRFATAMAGTLPAPR